MTPNYVIIIEKSCEYRSELGETHTPAVFLPTVGWQQSGVKIFSQVIFEPHLNDTQFFPTQILADTKSKDY